MDSKVNLAGMDERELYRYRTEVVEHFSKIEMELEQRRQQNRHHLRGSEVDWQPIAPWISSLKTEIEWKPLIMPERGFPAYNFYSFMLKIPPRSRSKKYHVHGQAIKYYLKGRGIEHIGDQTYEVEAGDFMLVPANVWHGTENPTDEPIEIYGVQMVDGTYVQVPALIASAEEEVPE